MNEQDFFAELLDETERAFQQSPVKRKQDELGRTWNYSVCATPIRRKAGVLFGLNWGGGGEKDINPETNKPHEYAPQCEMPDGTDIQDYKFIQRTAPYLSKYLGISDPSKLNYSNLCFFRSPSISDLQEKDWQLALPLFRKYIEYIDLPWLLMLGTSGLSKLEELDLLTDLQMHTATQNNRKHSSYSGRFERWEFMCVPHPQAMLHNSVRDDLWQKVCTELETGSKKTTTTVPLQRPRRLRRSENLRRMARETRLSVDNLVAPLFVVGGKAVREAIASMPGQYRLSIDTLVKEATELHALGIPAVALFPKIDDVLKTPTGEEGLNPDGLFPRAVRALKEAVPDLLVITDVALDPYSSDGHDGIVRGRRVANDETLAMLAAMAVVQADAGADIIAPSDMMDGRVAAIRAALDDADHTDKAILAYTAKYASAYYGPFRDALDSAPRQRGDIPADKKTYQMDPANAREALRELALDLDEGADMVMVKPAVPYLDVIYRVRERSDVPVAAYHVSGEYAMLQAAAQNGWLDLRPAATEALTAIRRAGADVILTYFARQMAEWLQEDAGF